MKSSSSSSADRSLRQFQVLGAEMALVQRLVAQLKAQGIRADAADAADLVGLRPDPACRTSSAPQVLLLGLPSRAQASEWMTDDMLRAALRQSGQAFQVLYGDPEAQLRQALLLAARPTSIRSQADPSPSKGRWHALCETCSDPDCERQLFHALNTRRDSEALSGKP